MPPDRLAKKVLSAYAEVEPCGGGPDRAVACLHTEEALAWGNRLFQGLCETDALWHASVLESKVPYDEALRRQIEDDYRSWLEASERLLPSVETVEGWGCEVRGADEFRRNCAEARGLLTPDDEFFGDALVGLRDEAVEEHRGGRATDLDARRG